MLLFATCSEWQPGHLHQQSQTKKQIVDSTPAASMDHANHQSHASRSGPTFVNDTDWTALPTNQTVISKQETVKPFVTEEVVSIPANGYITLDPRRNLKVSVRFGGRIERLFVKYNYQYVHKGETIMELYSPELSTYTDEYLFVKKNVSDSVLLKKTKEKLLLLGLTLSQIDQLGEAGGVPNAIAVYSPADGYVVFGSSNMSSVEKENNSTSLDMGAMTGEGKSYSSSSQSPVSLSNIREGMYVNKNQTVFWINDYRRVWGILAFNSEDENYIRKGQDVLVESEILPEETFRSQIELTEPLYSEGQKFTQARIYLSNEKKLLRENSLINAKVLVPTKSTMLPSSAVFFVGRLAIVWVQVNATKGGSKVFQSRVVKVGRRIDDNVEVLSGLKANELVAKDAAYLVDSESIISFK